MPRFMSRANLSLQGRTIVVGDPVSLDDDSEVDLLVSMNMLIRANPDGTFSDPPPPPPISCCGSGR